MLAQGSAHHKDTNNNKHNNFNNSPANMFGVFF